MSHKARVAVRARAKAVVTGEKHSFQAEIVPNVVLEGEALYEKLGNRTAFGAVKARRELKDCLRRKLDLTNELSNVRPRVFGIAELGAAPIPPLPSRRKSDGMTADCPAARLPRLGAFGIIRIRQ